MFCTLSSWSLSFNMGAFLENRLEVFPLGDQSSCTALWRRIETSRSEWRIGKWKKNKRTDSMKFQWQVLCCFLGETHGTLLGLRSPDDSFHWVTLWDHSWKETAVLFLGVWNNWSIWSITSCWSMTFLEDFCWGGRFTILWIMNVHCQSLHWYPTSWLDFDHFHSSLFGVGTCVVAFSFD